MKSWGVALALSAVAITLIALVHADAALPVLACAMLWAFGRWVVKPARPEFLVALAATGALFAWNMSGVAALGAWRSFAVDLAFMVGVFLWLWFRPGRWPVLLLSGYLVWSLLSQAVGVGSLGAGSDGFRTAMSQIVLQAVGLVAVWAGFVEQRRSGDA